MNLQKLNLYTFLVSILSLTLISCSDDDDNVSPTPEGDDTFEIIANSENHNTLEGLLQDTGLDQVLNDGFYTVFAPTDDAFSNVDLSSLNNDQLTNVLLNHVIVGESFFQAPPASTQTTFSTGYFNTSATGVGENNLDLYINIGDDIVLNGESNVTSPDLNANNGVVHVVDEVIPMPDITTFVTADPALNDLLEALTRNDQPDFVTTLSTPNGTDPAPFTVFAPRNDLSDSENPDIVFQNLLNELNLDNMSEIPQQVLTEALNSHVVAGDNITSGELPEDEVIPIQTLGDEISLNTGNLTITDLNDRDSSIDIVDIQATNGVIHAIDQVILPQQ
jgi:transforming growth factor-beta-induced protein